MEKLNERLPNEAKTVWRIHGIIIFVVLMMMVVAYGVIRLFVSELPYWPIWLGVVFAGIMGIIHIFITPPIKMMYWGYELREEEIDIQYGLIVIRRTLIPMTRIQHVDTEHGPIQRRFKLATLSISTAGGNHKIPALKEATANALRQDIARLANMSEDEDE